MNRILSNITRTRSVGNYIIQNNLATSSVCQKSSKVAPAEENLDSADYSKDDFNNINIKTKLKHIKQPNRPPFMKNMFLGIVDKDLLAYPESLSREEQADVEEERARYETILKDENKADIERKLKDASVFGSNVPLNWYGKDFIETEYSLLSEVVANDLKSSLSSIQHNTVAQLIVNKCSEATKARYLEKMATGEFVAALALFEKEISDKKIFSCHAVESDDGSWILNGTKTFVLNGPDASLFLVIASTETRDELGDRKESLTLFLVDAGGKGVTKSVVDNKLGLKPVPQISLTFKDVHLSNEHVVGEVGSGAELISSVLTAQRIRNSVLGVNMMKKILNTMTDISINTRTHSGYLTDLDLINIRLGRLVCPIYAAESMIYMTTGLLDDFENQDVNVEAAIVQTFVNENLLAMAFEPVKVFGPRTLVEGDVMEEYLRDAIQLSGHGETLDSVKMFIALSGLQHTGVKISEMVRKERNPAMNPNYIMSKLFDRNCIDTPKITHGLGHYLHKSLDPAADWLEMSIVRLQLATEIALNRNGSDVLDKHNELLRLSECAMLVYAMFSAISRASRAYCIGLRFADHEMLVASAFCWEAMEKVKVLSKNIENGPYLSNDENHAKIATQLFSSKGYFLEHPLTKNY